MQARVQDKIGCKIITLPFPTCARTHSQSMSYTVPIYGPLYLCVRKMIHFNENTTAAVVLEKFEHSTQLNKDLIRKR